MLNEIFMPYDHPESPWGDSVVHLRFGVLSWSGKAGDTATLGVTTDWDERYSTVYRMSPLSIVVQADDIFSSVKPGSGFVRVAQQLSWGVNELDVTKTFKIKTHPNSPGENSDETVILDWRYDYIPSDGIISRRKFANPAEFVIRGESESRGESERDAMTGLPATRQIFKGTDVVKNLGVAKARELAQSILDLLDARKAPDRFDRFNDWLYKKLSVFNASDRDISRIRRNIRATGGIRG
jgi:hypothetical protein